MNAKRKRARAPASPERQFEIPLKGVRAKVFARSRREAVRALDIRHRLVNEYHRKKFVDGDPGAALAALQNCADHGLPMPDWLAKAVSSACHTALVKAHPDHVLGLGNARMLAKWRKANRRGRDDDVRRLFSTGSWTIWRMIPAYQNKSRAEFIAWIAKHYRMSVKNVEAIVYQIPKNQTKK